ncbi:MAG: hypothetical protein DVB26_08165 [Verrucomicrobia bacterium]|nr:MAG: hypothetical protein DVB26_08165 [Verrucomicrobiota bacterium]
MQFIHRLTDRIKYKTKIVTKVENGIPVRFKTRSKRFSHLQRKIRTVGKFALYVAVIILSIVTACAIAYAIGHTTHPRGK